MILVVLGVCIVMVTIGAILFENYDCEGLAGILTVIGGIVGLVALVATITLCIDTANLRVIDDRIAMYQEENDRIELQIESVVEQYQKYETEVQSQIDIYLKNNDIIKDLRNQKIEGKVKQWWLYFGGRE